MHPHLKKKTKTKTKKKEKPELHELVKLYQLHRHSKIWKNYKNEACRFKFGKFFSKETTPKKEKY